MLQFNQLQLSIRYTQHEKLPQLIKLNQRTENINSLKYVLTRTICYKSVAHTQSYCVCAHTHTHTHTHTTQQNINCNSCVGYIKNTF
jgi:hypothetical protein